MADAYMAFLLDRCERCSGNVFVAEVNDSVVGFVSVLAKVLPEEPDEDQAEYAYITDLVVLPSYRRQGLGRTYFSTLKPSLAKEARRSFEWEFSQGIGLRGSCTIRWASPITTFSSSKGCNKIHLERRGV